MVVNHEGMKFLIHLSTMLSLALIGGCAWHGKCIVGDCSNGRGTNVRGDGITYVGEWKNGRYHGQGTRSWPTGDKYVGQYKEGDRFGQGTYTFADGSKYIGGWRFGYPAGAGEVHYPDGSRVVGSFTFEAKMFLGRGTIYYADGRTDRVTVTAKVYCSPDRRACPFLVDSVSDVVESTKPKQTAKKKNPEERFDSFDVFKAECEEIGFKPGTEKFGECVLELSR